MARNRRADAVVFGFDFQVNAAIVLFLENVRDVASLRLEGNYEDIEIRLNNDEYVLAQAKAVEDASNDFRNVRKNMKKSIASLSEADNKADAKELIMITNSPNPFYDDASRSAFYGPAHRTYKSLPESARELVDSYLNSIKNPLNTNKFKVQILPFETDDDEERYKVVMQCINDFIGELNPNIPGLGKQLLDIWHWQIFDNGGKKNASIKLQKKDMIWPILVKITENNICDDEFLDQFDPGIYEEVRYKYSETIENHCERCEFFIKILSEYSTFKTVKKPKEKIYDFIEQRWSDYAEEFSTEVIDDKVKEAITKLVIYYVIKRRIAIERVKEGTNI